MLATYMQCMCNNYLVIRIIATPLVARKFLNYFMQKMQRSVKGWLSNTLVVILYFFLVLFLLYVFVSLQQDHIGEVTFSKKAQTWSSNEGGK